MKLVIFLSVAMVLALAFDAGMSWLVDRQPEASRIVGVPQ